MLFIKAMFIIKYILSPFAHDKYSCCLTYSRYSYFLIHLIKVVLQNNESVKSRVSMQFYRAPAGRKYTYIIMLSMLPYFQSSVNNINLLETWAVTARTQMY